MNTLSYKTVSVSKENAEHKWYIVDAENMVVGRLSSQIAAILRGKNKPSYTPHADTGDFVIVINADKARFTGNKMNAKEYLTYSHYPGGQKSATTREVLAKKPTYVLDEAIKGMLPKNKLGRAMRKKLFLYTGNTHPHQAQQPVTLTF